MKVGIVGTGTVGRTLAQGFTGKGHEFVIGTRDVDALMARIDGDAMGNPPFAQWKADHPEIGLTTQADAMAHGEIVVNATSGEGSEAALGAGASTSAERSCWTRPTRSITRLDGRPACSSRTPIRWANGCKPPSRRLGS
jgi:8-hydroxy-5-deazaflavin:NADPH oxidoreductase